MRCGDRSRRQKSRSVIGHDDLDASGIQPGLQSDLAVGPVAVLRRIGESFTDNGREILNDLARQAKLIEKAAKLFPDCRCVARRIRQGNPKVIAAYIARLLPSHE